MDSDRRVGGAFYVYGTSAIVIGCGSRSEVRGASEIAEILGLYEIRARFRVCGCRPFNGCGNGN